MDGIKEHGLLSNDMRIALLLVIILAFSILGLAGCAMQPPPSAPVIVQAPTPPPKPAMPINPYLSLPSDVASAIRHGEAPVFQHGVTTIYPFDPDAQYDLNCQPLEATQIRLTADEWTSEKNVILGDSERWSTTVGDGVVLVKPLRTILPVVVAGPQGEIHPPAPNMHTNMIIHTSLHDYTFKLGIAKPLTEAVSFYYPVETRAAYDKYVAAMKHPEDYR